MSRLWAGRWALQAFVLALLGACAGGGGGGGGGPVITSPPPTPPVFPPLAPPHAPGDFPAPASAEFTNNWAVAGINAQIAWQNNATGAGVLIGVIDDGIHPEHPELAGRIDPRSIDIVAGRNALVTDLSHGSELSSLMVGNYNGSQTVGAAFDATVLAVRADNGSGFFDVDLAAGLDYARTAGVDVVNFSLGSSAPTSALFRQSIQNATSAGIIVVVSAGNSGGSGATQPNYPAFLATSPTVSNGLMIVAGGLNSNGTLNTASNPPGAAAAYYLVAPGWQIIVPDFGPAGPVPGFQTCFANLCEIQGTSYASPMITAAVALVMDGFPGLTPQQVVQLLFTTADDLGAPGVDAVYGQGRLNVGRAFQAVGNLSAPLASGTFMSSGVMGAVGPAFGDGITGSSAWSMVGFDAFDRTFPIDLSSAWINAGAGPGRVAQAPQLWRSERTAFGANVQAAFAESAAPESLHTPLDRAELEQTAMRIDADLAPGFTATFAANGARASYDHDGDAVTHLDSVNSDLSLRLTRTLGDGFSLSVISERGLADSGLPFSGLTTRDAQALRASFDRDAYGFDVTFGRLHEEQGVLGLVWTDALGQTPGGDTRFAGFGAHIDIAPGVRLQGGAEFGVAGFDSVGWLSVAEPLRTTAFSLEARAGMTPVWLTQFGGQGALTFSVRQPLRVEDGALSFMAPTADKYGRQSLAFEQRTFSPTPSGRELRLGLGYSYWVADRLSAFGEALYVLDPGHVASAEPDTVLRVGLRVAH